MGIGSDRPVPSLVEHDEPAERAQTLPQFGERRHVPLSFLVAEPLVEQEDVRRPSTEHLVRQVEAAESGVLGLRAHGAHRARCRQPRSSTRGGHCW